MHVESDEQRVHIHDPNPTPFFPRRKTYMAELDFKIKL